MKKSGAKQTGNVANSQQKLELGEKDQTKGMNDVVRGSTWNLSSAAHSARRKNGLCPLKGAQKINKGGCMRYDARECKIHADM